MFVSKRFSHSKHNRLQTQTFQRKVVGFYEDLLFM